MDSRLGEGAGAIVCDQGTDGSEWDRGGAIKSARLYATALGAYEMFVNGNRVGDQVLAPGWTDYRERVTYQTYDVTALVKHGQNAIGRAAGAGVV